MEIVAVNDRQVMPMELANPTVQELLGFRTAAYRLSLRVLGTDTDVSDVLQQAYLEALDRIRTDGPPQEARQWFLRVVALVAKNHLRKETNRRKREAAVSAPGSEPGKSNSRELLELLAAEMNLLDDSLSAPIALCCEEGLSQREAAAVLDMPQSTVSKYIRTGLEKLRKALAEKGYVLGPAAISAGLKQGAPEMPLPLSLAIERLVASALTGKAVAGASAGMAGVWVGWKLMVGVCAATLAGLGLYWEREPKNEGAREAATPDKDSPRATKNTQLKLRVTPRGAQAQATLAELRRRKVKVDLLGMSGRYGLLNPPKLRGKALRANEYLNVLAKFNGLKVHRDAETGATILHTGVADATLNKLQAGLKSPDPDRRVDAAWQAGYARDIRMLPALIVAAGDKNEDVSWEALRSLRKLRWRPVLLLHGKIAWNLAMKDLADPERISHSECVEALAEAASEKQLSRLRAFLKNKSSHLAAVLAKGRVYAGDADALRLLQESLRRNDRNSIRSALEGLGELGGEKAVVVLEKYVGHHDGGIRKTAISSLGHAGGKRTIALLRKMAIDPRRGVREPALEALANSGADGVGLLLSDALERSAPSSPTRILEAIGRLGGERGYALLARSLSNRGQAPYVRARVVTELGNIGSPKARTLVKASLRDQDRTVRTCAALALLRIGDSEALATLKGELTRGGWLLKARVADAQYLLPGSKRVTVLGWLLADATPSVREAALRGAGGLSDEQALGLVGKHIASNATAYYAVQAIVRIGGARAREILEKHLGTADPRARARIASQLMGMRSRKGVAAAEAILRDQREGADSVAAHLNLGKGSLEKRLELIGLALADKRKWVRSNAIHHLRYCDGERARRLMEKAYADKGLRSHVVHRLGVSGTSAALPILGRALTDPDAAVRRNVPAALARIGGEQAIRMIGALLSDRDKWVRRRAAESLARMETEAAASMLRRTLKHRDPSVAGIAAAGLVRRGEKEGLAHFESYLDRQDAVVLGTLAPALRDLPTDTGLPIFRKGLRHKSSKVRLGMLQPLMGRDGPKVLGLLREALRDPDPTVRRAVARALERAGDDRALPLLEHAMADQDPTVSQRAVSALRGYGGPKVLLLLRKQLDSSDMTVRLTVLQTLGRAAGDRAVAVLKAALASNEVKHRQHAIQSIRRVGPRKCFPLLEATICGDKAPHVRGGAASVLFEVGGEDAIRVLRKALEDDSDYVRSQASWALTSIGGTSARDAVLARLKTEKHEGARKRMVKCLQRNYATDPVVRRSLRELGLGMRPASKPEPREVF